MQACLEARCVDDRQIVLVPKSISAKTRNSVVAQQHSSLDMCVFISNKIYVTCCGRQMVPHGKAKGLSVHAITNADIDIL